MILKNCEFSDYTKWDHQIHSAATEFEDEHNLWPNVLLMNAATLEAIDLFMSKKLIAEGKVDKVKGISVFASEDGEIEICLDEEILDHSFRLIYDEDAEFVEEDSQVNDYGSNEARLTWPA